MSEPIQAAVEEPVAEEAGGDTGVEKNGKQQPKPEQKPEKPELDEPKFSQREVDSLISKVAEKVQREIAEKAAKEKEEIEKNALREQGKWQELAEKNASEAEKLRREMEETRFRDEVRGKMTELKMSEFAELILGAREIKGLTDAVDVASKLKESFDSAVEREVAARLETGKRPGAAANQKTVTRLSDLKTLEAKAAFVKEFGEEAFRKLVEDSLNEPKN